MYVERPQADVSLASWEANGAGSDADADADADADTDTDTDTDADADADADAAPIMDFRAVRATAPHHTLK